MLLCLVQDTLRAHSSLSHSFLSSHWEGSSFAYDPISRIYEPLSSLTAKLLETRLPLMQKLGHGSSHDTAAEWLTARTEAALAAASQPDALSARRCPRFSLIMSIAALSKLLTGRQVTFPKPLNMQMSLSCYFCPASSCSALHSPLPSSWVCFRVLPSHNDLLSKSAK